MTPAPMGVFFPEPVSWHTCPRDTDMLLHHLSHIAAAGPGAEWAPPLLGRGAASVCVLPEVGCAERCAPVIAGGVLSPQKEDDSKAGASGFSQGKKI